MAYKLGLDCKLYYSSSGVSGAKTLATNVRDVTLSVEATEADLTTRGSGGWEAIVAALLKGSLEFDIVWDTADAFFTALQTAFFAKSIIGIWVLDAATPSGQGLKADMSVLKFSRNEPLTGGVTVSVSLKPAYGTTPAWGTW